MINKGLKPELSLQLNVNFKDVSDNHVNIIGEMSLANVIGKLIGNYSW